MDDKTKLKLAHEFAMSATENYSDSSDALLLALDCILMVIEFKGDGRHNHFRTVY